MEDTELSPLKAREEAREETPDQAPQEEALAQGFEAGQLVDHFRVIRHIDSHRLYAATDLGSHLVWDLTSLNVSWCTLLRQIWRRVPVSWKAGRPVLGPPPAGHRCHRR